MSNSKTTVLKNSQDQIVGYRITKKDGERFDIPILDNRNPKHQERIAKTTKERNTIQGSKFFQQSYSAWGFSYNHSMKR
jgi:hypothetical protein